MTVRPASLLVVALALLPAPTLAQDSAADAPPAADEPAPADAPAADPPPPEDASAEPAPEPEEAPSPSPAAAPPLAPMSTPAAAPPPSPFTPDQRSGWLGQCRSAFQRAGATLGGGNGLPDACETQLLEFERNYVPRGDGQPPVIYVRVPVVRPPAAPVDPLSESPEPTEDPEPTEE